MDWLGVVAQSAIFRVSDTMGFESVNVLLTFNSSKPLWDSSKASE